MDKKTFSSNFEEFIYVRTYSRWIEELKRRETWPDTVKRYYEFIKKRVPENDVETLYGVVESILNFEVMPSMRALWTAGKALERENICGFNCSATTVDDPAVFSEILYILLCGTGCGFSVERQFINKMPAIPSIIKNSDEVIVFADSKLGWAEGYAKYIRELYKGGICKYDLSKIRKSGERLKTFGGRASGPEPLQKLMEFTKNTFLNAKGRKLTSIECHDIICYIASVVVVGGVRRCLPVTSKIQTNKGLIPLSDVEIGDFVITGGKEYKILDKEFTGIKQTLKIKHQYGDITCTPDHRLAVFDSNDPNKYIFKHAKDVQKGDCLVWDSMGFDGIKMKIPFTSNNSNTDIAWLIGVMHGCGCVRGENIVIYSENVSVTSRANNILKNFGIGLKLLDQFRLPKVPDFIFNNTKDVRYAYLAGLFDSINETSKQDINQVVTIYKTLFNDVKQLLYGIGIGSRTYIKGNAYYMISIEGVTNKRTWLSKISKFCCSGKEKLIEDGTDDFRYKASMFNIEEDITLSTAKQKGLINDVIYYPSIIEEVFDYIEVETCDIEVDNIKQFTTNGIVVHNSATISLSNLSDNRMAHAKDGNFYNINPQRALANNSVCYTEKPDCLSFLDEWTILARSQSGERGIFNREGIIKHLKKHVPKRNPNFDFITNPCVPYNTLILTNTGYKKIGDVVGQKIKIWNGREFSTVEPFYTGNEELYEVTLSDGASLKCTGGHKWVLWNGKEYRKETQNLIVGEKLAKFNMPIIEDGINYEGDAYSQGFYTGDGTRNSTRSYIYKPKYCCESRLIGEIKQDGDGDRHSWIHGHMMDKEFTPINGTKQYCLDWFAGYIDADGHTQKYDKSYGLQITSIDYQQLLDIKLMLTRFGCNPKIKKCCEECKKAWGDKTYISKDTFRLCLNAKDLYTLYTIGLRTNRVSLNIEKPQRDARRFITIESITKLNIKEDVYCFTEPLNHTGTFNGIVTGQCGEIILRPNSFCNLTEVVVRADDTLETLLEKVEKATILGCIQSTFTKFKFLRKQWTDNSEEERLLGVSLTGLRDHHILNHVHNTAKYWLEELKSKAIQTSRIWANKLGINEPAAITCVKPSGCTTLDTKIKTTTGIKTMNEIFTENDVNLMDAENGSWFDTKKDIWVYDENNNKKLITKLFVNGIAEVYDIEFEDGNVYTFTGNHKLKTSNGFKRVDELTADDEIISF